MLHCLPEEMPQMPVLDTGIQSFQFLEGMIRPEGLQESKLKETAGIQRGYFRNTGEFEILMGSVCLSLKQGHYKHAHIQLQSLE